MRIVFMGTPEFARRSLVSLCDSSHEVIAVVTGQSKRRGRGNRVDSTAVYQEAEQRGLSILTPASLKSKKFHDQIRKLGPDLIVVVAFRVLPEALYTIPKHGSINIHGSLLPKYRGAAPINWALINGESETGLTSFLLKKSVDTGDIILQEKIKIADSDNFDSLYDRMADLSGPFLLKTIDRIASGAFTPKAQINSEASPAPKIGAFDAMIDFGFPAEKVRNFVRGMASKPGAYTFFRERKVKILACKIAETSDGDMAPGAVVPDKRRLIVQCANSAIEVTRVVPEGKKEMSGTAFKNGMKPETGELLGKITEKVEEN